MALFLWFIQHHVGAVHVIQILSVLPLAVHAQGQDDAVVPVGRVPRPLDGADIFHAVLPCLPAGEGGGYRIGDRFPLPVKEDLIGIAVLECGFGMVAQFDIVIVLDAGDDGDRLALLGKGKGGTGTGFGFLPDGVALI